MDTPDRVKRIMDSVKQKLENPNKITLKQFNRQLKATTPSLTASFPFQLTITKKIKKSLASTTSRSQVHQRITYGTYSPKLRPHLLLTSLPTSFMKFLVMTALQWTDEPTLNQKDQRTWIPLKTPLTQPSWLFPQSICSYPPITDHWTQDSLWQNNNTHNYKIQDTTGPHRTHSH